MSFLSSSWFRSIEQIAPLILAATPLAPIAPFVALGIHAAEQVEGASGEQKLAIAKQITDVAVNAVNAQAGHQAVDPTQVSAAFSGGVGTVIAVANIVNQAKAEVAAASKVAGS